MEDDSDHSPSFLGYDKMQWRYSFIKSMTWIILQVALKVFKQKQEDNWIKKEKSVNQSFTNTYKPPLNTWTPILHSPMSRYTAWKMSIFQSNTMYESQFCFIVLKVLWTARRSNLNPKTSQSWIFIGRTDAEAAAPILWPSDAKSWRIEKDPDAGKDWRREEKGTTENKMVGWTWIWASSESWWWTGKPGMLQSMGLQRVGHNWATELKYWYSSVILKPY